MLESSTIDQSILGLSYLRWGGDERNNKSYNDHGIGDYIELNLTNAHVDASTMKKKIKDVHLLREMLDFYRISKGKNEEFYQHT